MAEKLQTISEIRRLLALMFEGQWPAAEAGAMITVIIEEYTGMSGARQMAFGTEPLPPEDAAAVIAAAKRAAAGEPLQYITGSTLFCGHRIIVEPGVLIPRPETEEMTAMMIDENPGFTGSALDLGTGSGCIAVSVAAAFPHATVFAADNSEKALAVAALNASANKTPVNFLRLDILSAQPSEFPPCSIIISNPPYVRQSEKKLMRTNVLDHEPPEALFVNDDDPLVFYRRIASIADSSLPVNGKIYLEINEALGRETAELFKENGFKDITVTEDINGRKRFLKALKK